MITSGITGATQMFNTNNATKTTKTGDDVQFSKNVMACVAAGGQKVMSDMKTLGKWDLYLSYDKWINDIVNYCKNKGYMQFYWFASS